MTSSRRTNAVSLLGLKNDRRERRVSARNSGATYLSCVSVRPGMTRCAACSTVRSSLLVMIVPMKISFPSPLSKESPPLPSLPSLPPFPSAFLPSLPLSPLLLNPPLHGCEVQQTILCPLRMRHQCHHIPARIADACGGEFRSVRIELYSGGDLPFAVAIRECNLIVIHQLF